MFAADHVEHDADALRELVEEELVDLAERQERSELDHCFHFALEQNRHHENVARRCFAKP